jgi:hypothetical protein
MAIVDIETVKSKFESGDNPSRVDYVNMIDTLAALPAVENAIYDTDQAVISMQVFG